MKAGANFMDQNTIAAMVDEGHSAEEISQALKIDLSCVARFVAHFTEKAEASQAGKAGRTAKAAKQEMEEGGTRPQKG